MKRLAMLGVMLVPSLLCGACGGVALSPPPADGGAGTGGATAGADGGGGGGGGHAGATGGAPGHASPCPGVPPQDGAACSNDGLRCGWGDDPRGEICRTVAICASGAWQVAPPSATSCPPLQPVGACPADLGAACTMDTTCTKPDGSACRCTDCRPTAPLCGPADMPTWYCPRSPTTAGCPPTPPNFGTPCAVEGLDCNYFFFECSTPDRVCSQGIWVPSKTFPSCPQSSRRAKKDIRYLTDDGVAAMAARTLRLRLATYEYKAPPLAGRRHLGFVIEDSPDVPAVDRDGDLVDLYGYASMLLATTQAQQRQIESLRRQVEDLSRTVGRLGRPAPRKIEHRLHKF
jgi:hypothetical protein